MSAAAETPGSTWCRSPAFKTTFSICPQPQHRSRRLSPSFPRRCPSCPRTPPGCPGLPVGLRVSIVPSTGSSCIFVLQPRTRWAPGCGPLITLEL